MESASQFCLWPLKRRRGLFACFHFRGKCSRLPLALNVRRAQATKGTTMADDDDDEDDEEEDEEEEKSGGSLKMILIAVGVLVVLVVGGGGGAFYFGALDDLLGLETSEQAAKREARELAAIEAALPPVFHEFPVLVVDLKQPSKKRRSPYIKISVVAELSQKNAERLKVIEVKILDGFQTHLREQTRDDVSGKAGTDKLRLAFLDIVNNAMAPGRVEAVHFRQIILQ